MRPGVPKGALAIERARLLAALAQALAEIQVIVPALALSEEQRGVARDLYLRVEAARLEVQSLRLGRSHVQPDRYSHEWESSAAWPAGPAHRPLDRVGDAACP